jgi:hypothetical protein
MGHLSIKTTSHGEVQYEALAAVFPATEVAAKKRRQ